MCRDGAASFQTEQFVKQTPFLSSHTFTYTSKNYGWHWRAVNILYAFSFHFDFIMLSSLLLFCLLKWPSLGYKSWTKDYQKTDFSIVNIIVSSSPGNGIEALTFATTSWRLFVKARMWSTPKALFAISITQVLKLDLFLHSFWCPCGHLSVNIAIQLKLNLFCFGSRMYKDFWFKKETLLVIVIEEDVLLSQEWNKLKSPEHHFWHLSSSSWSLDLGVHPVCVRFKISLQ